MLAETSQEFRKMFLFYFTKELVLTYGAIKGVKTKVHKKKELKNIIRKTLKKTKKKEEEILTREFPRNKLFIKPLPTIQQQASQKVLSIPETKLPSHLRYLRPTATEKEIDLGKLNPLVKDPVVKAIECNGPDKKIIIHTPSRKTTKVSLTKEEIEKIIKIFSESSKIPAEEGIVKMAFGKLVLSAIISKVVGSKFIIKKLFYNTSYKISPGLIR